jgi:type II secretory pathway component PulK
MSINQRQIPSDQRITPCFARRRAPVRAGRRGVALFLLLVFLALAAMFMTGWLTSAASERRAGRLAEDRLQAAWLAQSAVERADAQLTRDGDYQGETWKVSAEELAGGKNAVVSIKIERSQAPAANTPAEEGASVNAVIEVQLRDGDETVVRTNKQVSVRLSKPEESL